MLIRKDAIHPPPIETEKFLLNLVKMQKEIRLVSSFLNKKKNIYIMFLRAEKEGFEPSRRANDLYP